MSLWKQASTAQELFEGMVQNQDRMVLEEELGSELRTLKALDELNKAAELYMQAGEIKKANNITQLMKKIVTGQDTVLWDDDDTIPASSEGEEVRNVSIPKEPGMPEFDFEGYDKEPSFEDKKTDPSGLSGKVKQTKLEAEIALYKLLNRVSGVFGEDSSLIKTLENRYNEIENKPVRERVEGYRDFIMAIKAILKDDTQYANDNNDKKDKAKELLKVLKHFGFLSEKDLRRGDKNDVFVDDEGNLRAHGR